ncbi:Solute carrier organic anion transporter family member 3A1-like protein [Leptotrombidium deliense]|uniref:Solute carrier organic anion transporter family member 3A1-like protein n=1 Tax=Leptotrombidium deliense TaxID=299467 RepID=A0A443SLM5_9ACAR|nr:Solute carrier organic anion transporter family member 3A1-like protein [Leptotrombidium deliense]
MGFGMFFGGYLISKYKPKPKWLLFMMLFIGVLVSQTILANMFFACPQSAIQDNLDSLIVDNSYYMTTPCNLDCNCNQRVFQPVCSSDGSTELFSACHAGCSRVERVHKPERFFDCKCLGGGSAVSGLCAIDCSQSFYFFYFVCFVFGIINSLLTAGDTLVSLRCVIPEDKTFAFGFMQTFFSIFGKIHFSKSTFFKLSAWLPLPFIYEAISDSSCAVWPTKCAKANNCWIYEANKYRFLLHGVTYFFALLAAFSNLGVLCNTKKLQNFYNDNKLQESKSSFGVRMKRMPRIEDETD